MSSPRTGQRLRLCPNIFDDSPQGIQTIDLLQPQNIWEFAAGNSANTITEYKIGEPVKAGCR